ncbi:MAG: hypothetical protein AB9888_13295 [Bacteroidales bacterium]
MKQRFTFSTKVYGARLLGLLIVLVSLLSIASQAYADSVTLCFPSTGPGGNIKGSLPGQSAKDYWAGVLNVTVNSVAQDAFCTDLNNGIDLTNPPSKPCYSNSTLGVTNDKVACTLQYYPPVNNLAGEEAAARQAAVWHFSDGFTLTTTGTIATRYNDIVADIDAKYSATPSQCAAVLTPSISISPTSAVVFLTPAGSSYVLGSQNFTISAMSGTLPLANQTITVTTTNGAKINGAASPQDVTTGANGQAVVTITNNEIENTEVSVSMTVSVQQGTRIDPGATVQKVVLSGSQNVKFSALATINWKTGTKGVIKKFHDRNRNGVRDDENEEWLTWKIYYREANTASQIMPTPASHSGWSQDWTTTDAGNPLTLSLDASKSYDICESPVQEYQDGTTPNSNWDVTTSQCAWNKKGPITLLFGNVWKPALLIQKYVDLDGDGQLDTGEVGQDGVGFQVDRKDNGIWKATYSGKTANSGYLGWANISYFNYRIVEDVPDGWFISGRWNDSAAVAPADSLEVNVNSYKLYSTTFYNTQPGKLYFDKKWYIQNVQTTSPGTTAQICVKRTSAANAYNTLVPADGNGTALTLDATYGYCQAITSTATFQNLWPGDYLVQEKPMSEWTVPAAQTVKVTSGSSNQSSPIQLRNDHKLGEVKIKKTVSWNGTTPDSNGKVFSICLEKTGLTPICLNTQKFTADGNQVLTFSNLLPGTYTITESVGSEWLKNINPASVTVNADGSVTPALSGDAHAVVSNTYNKGKLVVTKTVSGYSGTTDKFTICITGPSYAAPTNGVYPTGACQVFTAGQSLNWSNLDAGTYTISEPKITAANGTTDHSAYWTATGLEGVQVNPGGAAATKTVTNTIVKGNLKVTKSIAEIAQTTDQFTICITGPSYAAPTNGVYPTGACQIFTAGQTLFWLDLIPGEYTISEPVITTSDGSTDHKAYWTASGTGSVTVAPVGTTFGTSSVHIDPPATEKTITNTYVKGKLEVTKSVSGYAGTTDKFTICITGPSYSTASCQIFTAGQTLKWENLLPGTYNVTETTITAADGTTNHSAYWTVSGTGNVTVNPGTTAATKTITNTIVKGGLYVQKVLSGTTSTSDKFTICLQGPSYPAGTTYPAGACKEFAGGGTATWSSLIPGLYTVKETAVTPSANTGHWTLAADQTVTVEPNKTNASALLVTNTFKPGGLKVKKELSGITTSSDKFTICLQGPSYPAGTTYPAGACKEFTGGEEATWTSLIPGSYKVVETSVSPASNAGYWTLAAEQNVTVSPNQTNTTPVVLTNTYAAGGLKVKKMLSGITTSSDKFTICLQGPSYPAGTTYPAGACKEFSGGEEATWSSLIPGSYKVVETSVSPASNAGYWTLSAEQNVTVSPNQTNETPVVLTNTYAAGGLKVKKVLSGITSTSDKFTICLQGPSYPAGATYPAGACKEFAGGEEATWSSLIPGQYTVKETAVTPSANTGHWTLAADQTVTVEPNKTNASALLVTNTFKPGGLKVKKELSGITTSSDKFTICLQGPSYPAGATYPAGACKEFTGGQEATWSSLIPGSYKVVETSVSPASNAGYWTLAAEQNVTVSPNQTNTTPVVLTNTYVAGGLKVKKVLSGITSTSDKFTICLQGPSYPAGATYPAGACKEFAGGAEATWSSLIPGQYTVKETAVTPSANTGHWTLAADQTVTVEPNKTNASALLVTNTFKPGGLKVKKELSGITTSSDKFTICLQGPSYPAGTTYPAGACKEFVGGEEATWTSLIPGSYKVVETSVSPASNAGYWTLAAAQNVTVSPNQTNETPVVLTNTYAAGSLKVKKMLSGITTSSDKFTICLQGPSYPAGATYPAGACKEFAGGQEETWSPLLPGLYTVKETAVSPAENVGNWILAADQKDIKVEANKTTPVDVTNTYSAGSLTVNKAILPAGYMTTDTFTICIKGPSYPNGEGDCFVFGGSTNPKWTKTWTNLIPGAYTVTETTYDAAKWTRKYEVKDNAENQKVDVGTSGTASYTVTNTIKPGGLTVKKALSGIETSDDKFTICLQGPSYPAPTGTTYPDGACKEFVGGQEATWSSLIPGSYKVIETSVSPASNAGYWTLAAEQNVTVSPNQTNTTPVVLTNTYAAGGLKVKKWLSGITTSSDKFTICLQGPSYPAGTTYPAGACKEFTGGEEATWSPLLPGLYTVKETAVSPAENAGNWILAADQKDIQVEANKTTPVEVTNTYSAGSLTVNKAILPAGYTTTDTFTICIKGPSFPNGNGDCFNYGGSTDPKWTKTWTNLIPGEYTVTETTYDSAKWTRKYEVKDNAENQKVSVLTEGTASYTVTNALKLGKVEATKLFVPEGTTTTDTFKLCLTGLNYAKNCKDVNNGNSWKASWENLIPQTYSLTEEITGDATRWVVSGTGDVVVNYGETSLPEVTNLRKPDLKFTKKLDWGTLTPVDGSYTFEICLVPMVNMYKAGAATEICETVTVTDETSISGTWENLEPDVQYRVEERGLPAGWILTEIVALPEQLQPQKVTPAAACVPGTDEQCTVIVTVNPYDGKVWIRQEERLVDEVVVTNAYQLGELNVTKTYNWAGASDPNVRFNICLTWPETPLPTPTAAKKECVMVGPNGTILVNGVDTGKSPSWNQLPAGEYTVSEEVVPEYPINPDAWQANFDLDVKLNFSNGVVTKIYQLGMAEKKAVSITNWKGNVPGAFASIEVIKKVEWAGAVTDEVKAIAKFNLCVEGPVADGKTAIKSCQMVGYLGTNGVPLKWEKLEPGIYKVSEEPLTTFPMDAKNWIVSLIANEKTTTFTNEPYIVEDVQVTLGNPTVVQVNNKQIPDVPPTAVTLNYFRSQKLPNRQVKLTWETKMESNNEGFVVYRATEKDFSKAQPVSGLIPSAKRPSTYSTIDTAPAKGTYYYWLVDIESGNTQHVNGDQFVLEVPVDDGGSWSRVFLPAITR